MPHARVLVILLALEVVAEATIAEAVAVKIVVAVAKTLVKKGAKVLVVVVAKEAVKQHVQVIVAPDAKSHAVVAAKEVANTCVEDAVIVALAHVVHLAWGLV